MNRQDNPPQKKPRVLTPFSEADFDRRTRLNFCKYLKARGAEMLEPTSQWEVLRFRTNDTVHIVYRNKKGRLSWTGETVTAYRAWKGCGTWEVPRMKRRRAPTAIKNLVARDGRECFFCGMELDPEARMGEPRYMTVEHLLSSIHQGPNRLENMAIACAPCNLKAGHKTVVEKVALRDLKRKRADAQRSNA